MAIRFSPEGPAFPADLIDAMLRGEVVFLCGAGVSTPQLPGFYDLVTQVYASIPLTPLPAEEAAIKAGRLEEALGALSRRLADPQLMQAKVAELLQVDNPDLANHLTLLRLSRDLDNQVVLVTTNFDPLFERGLDALEGAGAGAGQSLAGQALPPPGGVGFRGVIHLHGRMADAVSGVDETPIVLTSSEYGDAYMRSGWASRFLFDLVRCRTLVLVGYSAGDAPVRYFLNLLESDRERFPDIRQVYAFDGVKSFADSALARWDAVAVKPLPYLLSDDPPNRPHAVLWRDLASLAQLLERPKRWRRERVGELLEMPLADATEAIQDEVEWLLAGRRESFDLLVNGVNDPAWLSWAFKRGAVPTEQAGWMAAAWCARDWASQARLRAAVRWRAELGTEFCRELAMCLTRAPQPVGLMAKAWCLLAQEPEDWGDPALRTYQVVARLNAGICSDRDLREAVGFLTPKLTIEPRWGGDADAPDPPARLSDLYNVRLKVSDRGERPDLVAALEGADVYASRLMEIANFELASLVALAHEAEEIGEGWDHLDSDVPSVEANRQNEYSEGATHLVVLMAHLLAKVAVVDGERARRWAAAWRDLPTKLGVRMWTQALRVEALFTPNEVAQALIDLKHADFWDGRRELILAIAERMGTADAALVQALCARVIAEAPGLFANLVIEAGRTDWRPYARDRDAWLRLAALRRAGILPPEGEAELAAIAARHPHIAGDFREEDLFDGYVGEVQNVEGHPEALLDLDPGERLSKAKELAKEPDYRSGLDWRAYCRADPGGALDALRQSPFGAPDLGLWNDLIQVLVWSKQGATEEEAVERLDHVRDLFQQLDRAPDEAASVLSGSLVDLLPVAREAGIDTDDWWDRLWAIIEADETPVDLESKDRLYDKAVNRPAGRLVEQLIRNIDKRKTSRRRLGDLDRQRLRRVLASDTPAGWLARGILTRDIGFLVFLDRALALSTLHERMMTDDLQAQSLRTVLVKFARLGSKATRAFRKPLIRGVEESNPNRGPEAAKIASQVLMPLLSERLSGGRVRWGLPEAEVARVLASAPEAILDGAADCLEKWVASVPDTSPERVWREGIRPLFEAVWPKERRFKRSAVSTDLAGTCVGAGPAFPEAFAYLRPYLTPSTADWANIHFIGRSGAPEQHPAVVLELLWILCGPGFEGQSTELAKILDRLVVAMPALETDRRLQWLEQRAVRYG